MPGPPASAAAKGDKTDNTRNRLVISSRNVSTSGLPFANGFEAMQRHILQSIDPVVLGERLAEARRAKGWTQQETADHLGVARTTVTAMEKGERRPRAAELVQLAQLYGRSVGELVREEPQRLEPDFVVQFRKARSTSEAPEKRAQDIAQFERLCRWYADLERRSGTALAIRYPEPYDISGTSPERAGEEVASAERNRLGLGDGPIPDLVGVLESDVGLRIFAFPMQERNTAGMFLFTEEYGGCIAVNANHPSGRRHWSLAHEYAHFLTDRYRPEVTVFRERARRAQSERFAEAFAAHFLMPASGLQRRFAAIQRSTGGKITPVELLQLSAFYQVSIQAMILRLEDLELLPSHTWDRLKEIGFRPAKAGELLGIPVEQTGSPRLPRHYKMLAIEAYIEGHLSEGQLAERLLTDRVQARQEVYALTTETEPTESGEWRQVTLDLTASLAGTR